MEQQIIKINTISQLHEALGLPKPKHPLISVINISDFKIPDEIIGQKVSTGFYTVALKDSHCGMIYGRNTYDFDEGVLMFTAPEQVIVVTEPLKEEIKGWMLYFHPDLIRKFPLGEIINSYSFFNYENYEALHLSDAEEKQLNDCIEKIVVEYEQRIDNHSQKVIVASLDLLLTYCSRFYERQFNTRAGYHGDIVSQVEQHLKEFYNLNQTKEGMPTIQYLAGKVHLSAAYLSDVLKKETGQTGKEHINTFVVEKAKNMLLGSTDSVSEIAYSLGFNYPHYFSRLFKSKTGITPQEYRALN